MTGYSPFVIEHFDHPRNAGRLAAADDVIDAAAGSVRQGVSFHLSARLQADRAMEMRFEAYGCPHSIAAASWTCESLTGRSMAELAAWNWRQVAQVLDIPPEKSGRLLILEDAVKRLAEAGLRRA